LAQVSAAPKLRSQAAKPEDLADESRPGTAAFVAGPAKPSHHRRVPNTMLADENVGVENLAKMGSIAVNG